MGIAGSEPSGVREAIRSGPPGADEPTTPLAADETTAETGYTRRTAAEGGETVLEPGAGATFADPLPAAGESRE